MAVIDMHAAHPHALADTWFAAELDRALKYLTPQERVDAEAWCSHYVYVQALARRSRCMNTTEALREFVPQSRTINITLLADDWRYTALEPLYSRTGQDVEHAAKLYGNLVCRVGVRRPETWCSWKQQWFGLNYPESRSYVARARFFACILTRRKSHPIGHTGSVATAVRPT